VQYISGEVKKNVKTILVAIAVNQNGYNEIIGAAEGTQFFSPSIYHIYRIGLE